jgi:ubiquinone/menaquinone biosynthesis C-methylase UbiE
MQEKAAAPETIERTYDRGAQGYHDYWPQPHEFIEPERAAFLARMPKGGRILDIGCGPGQDAENFTRLGFNVTGIDPSEKFIEIARMRVPAARFTKGDMRKLDFPDASFDGAWACFSFHHVPGDEAPGALLELKRVLKPRGTLFISGHAADVTRTRTVPVSGLREEGSEEFLEVFFQEWAEPDFRKLIAEAGLQLLSYRAFTREGGPYELFASVAILPKI